MISRYDFGSKLDLTRFQKQAVRQIGAMRQVTFNLFVKEYKIEVDIATPDDSNSHIVKINLFEIVRDSDGEISRVFPIIPHRNTKFQDISSLLDLFSQDAMQANFESNSVTQTVEKISTIIKLVHKINDLKAFL